VYFTNIFDHIYVFYISLLFRVYIFFLLTLVLIILTLFIVLLLALLVLLLPLLEVLPQGSCEIVPVLLQQDAVRDLVRGLLGEVRV
jgi:hypothetical protein